MTATESRAEPLTADPTAWLRAEVAELRAEIVRMRLQFGDDMATITERSTAELAVEIAELRQAVLAMREELDRRDVEQMELEGVVEYLIDTDRQLRCVLGALITATIGDCPSKYHGDELLDQLYSGHRHEAGFCQGEYLIWSRPKRRWAQFGTRHDVLALADSHGVKVDRSDAREWIIRKLWRTRPLHGLIPGAVGPYK